MNMVRRTSKKTAPRIALTAACLLALLSGCGSEHTEAQDSSQNIVPTDPLASLQPLAPGFSWTYRLRVAGEPVCLRWLTKDFASGVGFAGIGLQVPSEGMSRGDHHLQYSVTGDMVVYEGAGGSGCFFPVSVVDTATGTDVTSDEPLWWGRWRRAGSPLSRAICEVREVGEHTRQIMEGPGIYGSGVTEGRVHFRYLTRDFLYDWPTDGEVSIGSLDIAAGDQWHVTSHLDPTEISVLAGSFSAYRTSFVYDFSGYTTRQVREELFYTPAVGLVKWTQSLDDRQLWSLELVSFDVDADTARSN